jgi:hypothetical protein
MYLNTARVPWAVLRAAVTVDDSALTVFDYDNWPTSKAVKLNDDPLQDANGLGIAFHGTDAADEDAAYNLYGLNRSNGMIQLLLEGVITLGTQVATTDPIDMKTTIANGKWADTITITGGLFSGDLSEVLDSGTNRIAMIKFDQRWIDELYLEIDLNTAASIYGIITGF